ncbi:hypothetical protein J5N97_009429 [Dioscorea zingiberensis]|uniref:SRR1-like domain-containing protein n=1 Tax=Dioscorea zingiberensis TaxID=325984 RepID=A0A9D5CY83_9LILI|nr:hypothetical protein J5N97_009429 [Dioscorea zingiberensis]
MNWCPSRLEKMMILCTSLTFMAEDLDEFVSCSIDGGRPKMTVKKLSYVRDRLRYIWGIKGHTRELEIQDCGLSSSVDKSQSYNPEEMFEDLCWHIFDVDGVEDMSTLLPSTENCFKWVDSDISYPYRMDEEDAEEFLKLQEDMKITTMELRESEYYHKLRDQLEEDHLLKREVSRRLGSQEKMEMVIYALGDLEYDFNSHYQLALALLLREEVDMLKIGEIQVFDPLLTPADANVIRSFGCTVLSVNEFARRRAEKPTLFFLPFAWFSLVANLLEANWSPSKLENLIILGTSLHKWGRTYEECPDVITIEESETEKLVSNDRLRYIRTIKDWSVEFVIDDGHQWCPFQQICWVFINLHSGIDLNSILPDFPTISKIQVDHGCAELTCDYISDLRECSEDFYWKPFKPNSELKRSFTKGTEYRGPSKHCKTWSPPPPVNDKITLLDQALQAMVAGTVAGDSRRWREAMGDNHPSDVGLLAPGHGCESLEAFR